MKKRKMEVKVENNKGCPQKAQIPCWMLKREEIDSIKSRGMNTGFLRRTLAEISRVIQDDLLAERYAGRDGLLQNIDARVKLVSILVFMIFAGSAKSFLTMVLLAVLAVMMVKLSGLGLSSYVKRVWLVLPLIVFIMSLPASTSLFIPGRPLLYVYRGLDLNLWRVKLPGELYFSLEGIKAVIKVSLRVGLSISFGYVLVMTTRWPQLTKSLRTFRVPALIITILDMTYRYIFALSTIAVDMFEARFLRTVGRIKNRDSRKFISGSMANLFIKSHYMSEEIYNSMQCRGYTGDPVCLHDFRLSRYDYVWMLNVLFIILILIIF